MTSLPYDFQSIESKWQARWDQADSYRAERYPTGPTYFVLVFPPYPNGRIHMGHVRNYTIGDAVARYKRMCGHSVLHPIGFDAFGLPNEIEAAKEGLEPEQITRQNIETMTRQLRRLGYSYDWKNAITTIDPEYYRWNQWLFLTLFEQNLAYRKSARVQWCPSCRTSLANEQVLEGRCWRCNEEVLSRHLRQWFFRLRAYAGEIWSEAETGAFPENIATMIQDWIGKTEGAELRFPIEGTDELVTVFTTKPELAYGATYLGLAPEHPLAQKLAAGSGMESELTRLRERVEASANPPELTDGLDTGWKALHPLTRETIPIWVAAYVDPEFATGAVMGNPCHDQKDHDFGRRHGLPGRIVVRPADSSWSYAERGPYLGDGVLTNSETFSGQPALKVRQDVMGDWEARGVGQRSTTFAVRDWLISRQRAWGTPIPIIECARCGDVPVDPKDLPVRLPERLRDTGEGNPLSQRPDFVSCRCPRCRGPAQRETDTMDTFIDTAWYYLRSTNPHYRESLCDPAAVARWGQADLYVGGIEISVPIMLYGSFIAKGLRDAGHLAFSLPCRRLLAHEMVLKDGKKMSKSLGNTVDPEKLIEEVGADSVRLFILSLAPPLKKIEWSGSRLRGCHRFLQRVWDLGIRQAARAPIAADLSNEAPSQASQRLVQTTHGVIQAVSRDMERLQPNTCITELIKFLYSLEELENEPWGDGSIAGQHAPFHEAFQTLLILLSPFTPHLCEELWARLGRSPQLSDVDWPRADPALLSRRTTQIIVKVNAKPVARLDVPASASQDEVMAMAYENEEVRACLRGNEIRREIYVPGQIINLVTS